MAGGRGGGVSQRSHAQVTCSSLPPLPPVRPAHPRRVAHRVQAARLPDGALQLEQVVLGGGGGLGRKGQYEAWHMGRTG